MNSFTKSLWANSPNDDPNGYESIQCELKETEFESPSQGQTLIEAQYSSMNYKDALALTGKGKILRSLPLIPGIDVAGKVLETTHDSLQLGDSVLVTGCGLGENICGGYSEKVLLSNESIIPLPKGLDARQAMILGTAGFTAGLALHQLELNGLHPDKGDVLVTGATGGVGSLSLLLLKSKGYSTLAWTRKAQEEDYLRSVGANFVGDISDKDWKTRPLASAKWAAAIDNVGGEVLSYILPRIHLWGSVASVGMARSPLLGGSVFPHILRGVNLLGISSANAPMEVRKKVWQIWSQVAQKEDLTQVLSDEVSLEGLMKKAQEMIAGKTKGRVLVKISA